MVHDALSKITFSILTILPKAMDNHSSRNKQIGLGETFFRVVITMI